jgi:hypothetical protein
MTMSANVENLCGMNAGRSQANFYFAQLSRDGINDGISPGIAHCILNFEQLPLGL